MGAPAIEVERLLEGSRLQRKPASIALLSGLGARLTRASELPSPSAPGDPLPTTVAALDRLLSGGLPRGGLVEISGRRSTGRFSIGVATLAAATSSGESAALVDLGSHLDPQSAEQAGVDLTRLLWVRPETLKDAVASAEMTLSAGFPLVVLDLGLPPVRGGCRRPTDGVSYCRGSAVGGRTVPDAVWVRLDRAARQRRAALLLLAPYRVSGVAAGAVLAADAMRPIWSGASRAPKLLSGITSRLTLQKDARARSGAAESMRLFVDGAPLAVPSLPATGEGGIFSETPAFRASSSSRMSPSSRALRLRSGQAPRGIPDSIRDLSSPVRIPRPAGLGMTKLCRAPRDDAVVSRTSG
jgi:recA bacterial DNA recombination protein